MCDVCSGSTLPYMLYNGQQVCAKCCASLRQYITTIITWTLQDAGKCVVCKCLYACLKCRSDDFVRAMFHGGQPVPDGTCFSCVGFDGLIDIHFNPLAGMCFDCMQFLQSVIQFKLKMLHNQPIRAALIIQRAWRSVTRNPKYVLCLNYNG